MIANFETTQWSLILEAADSGHSSHMSALEQLCRRYRPPLLAFARGFGLKDQDAQDVIQSFFLHLLEKNLPSRANPELGRFRSFLLGSLRNFIHVTHRNATRERRGGDPSTHVSLQDENHDLESELANEESPDLAFDREWAHTLIQIALDELEKEQATQGTTERYLLMRPLLLDPEGRDTVFAELQQRFNMADGAARTALSRLRTRFRELVRAEVLRIVQNPNDVDAEITHLLKMLR
ncbi:MAG: sigma-70 family RNA polymerase sigma factor [Verrucomicrobia bacterium]|nr:sigma-70 family RNA polymerase sigma factor [Verrucomicrobiota bacterium]